MIKKITYEDKVSIQNDESVAVVHKVTDTDMNEVKEVVNNNADELISLQADNNTNKTDISNIKAEQTSQNEYISQLEAENERLKQDLSGLPSGQEEGETIDLTDSAEMRFSSFEIRGNSRQESRSGKNKVKLNNIQETTKDGLKYSCRNGKLYLNGTLTKAVLIDFEATDIQAGNYYFSSYVEGNHSGSWARYLRTVNDGRAITNNGGIEISGDEKVYFRFYANEGCVFNNAIVTAQLEEGSSATEWEQYGASPSPDYPSEVECCGDNVNLFDKDNANVITGTLTTSSTSIQKATYSKIFYIPIIGGETYSIRKIIDTVGTNMFSIATSIDVPAVGVEISQLNTDKNVSEKTITTNSTANYLCVMYIQTNATSLTEQEIFNSIKIAKGTQIGGYSSYGQGCINEVVCNKNLFNKNDVTNGMYINRNSGATSTGTDAKNYSTSGFCKVKPNTQYYLGISYSSSNYGVVYYNKNKQYLSGKKLENTFTTPENCKYIRFTWITANYDASKIQLEEGTKATNYVQHQSQTYTIPTQQPIRSEEDTFVKVNGKWFEQHEIERYYFTGGEDFISVTNGSTVLLRTATFSSKIYLDDNTIVVKSNIATGYSNANWKNHRTENIVFGGTNGYIQFILPNITAVEDLKTYLAEQYEAGTPVYIDYVLATPKDIECTAEQIAILDKIYNEAKSYKGVTHIYSTDDVEPNVKVTYKKDLDTMINNLNTAIVAMGGV